MIRKLCAAVLLSGLAVPAGAHKGMVTKFTFHADVLPIFREKCASCHREGGVAPMSLLDYDQAYPWAVSIKNEVLALSMPPWFADERFGSFGHDRGLSADELNTVVDWCLGGAPEGEAAESETAVPDGEAWTLGEPGAVLEPNEPVILPADEMEAEHTLVLQPDVTGDRWVSAMDVRPGKASVVRSAVAEIVSGGERRFLGAWVPGLQAARFALDGAKRLPAGAAIQLTIRYGKTWLDEGIEIVDRSALALYFDEEPRREIATLALRPGAGASLKSGATIVSLVPRLASDVTSLAVDAIRPDGTRERLLQLRSPRRDWVRPYRLEEPLALEAGTVLEMTIEQGDQDDDTFVLVELVR